jgi:hypothetical protein
MMLFKKSVGVLLLIYLMGLTAGQLFILTHVDFDGYEPGLGGLLLVLATTLFAVYRRLRNRWVL